MLDRLIKRRRPADVRIVAAALGAITGVRSTAGMAALAHSSPGSGRLERLLARGTELMASGEFIADKAADLPARTQPAPLIGRAVLGGTAAAVFARRQGSGLAGAAVIGAAAAIATTVAATRLRRLLTSRTAVPDSAVGLAEDAIVLAGSAWIVRATADKR